MLSCWGQVYFLLLIALGIKFAFNLNTSGLSYSARLSLKLGIFLGGLILFYFENRYFLSNRVRRSQILEDFENLDEQRRKLWIKFAAAIMLFPLWGLLGIIFTGVFDNKSYQLQVLLRIFFYCCIMINGFTSEIDP